MRADYFDVSSDGSTFINLSLTFRVQIQKGPNGGLVTFFWMNNPEQNSSYHLTTAQVADLLTRLAQR